MRMGRGGPGSDPGGVGSEDDDELRSLPSEGRNVKRCLLDVLHAGLSDVDLRTAQRISAFTDEGELGRDDIVVGSFIVRLRRTPLLKEKFGLKLQIERNLDKAFSHRVPDMSVRGALSRLHAAIDVDQCE